jgi:uncharacterized protein YhdP
MATTRARTAWVAAGWLLVTAAALLGAYAAALARLPQQRAAIEALVRVQTGYELRFGRIAVRLGFYGPEAHFTNVEMWRPGRERRLLQAAELVIRFETWRLLRTGSLRPGRILLIGAQIDADALRPSPHEATAAKPAATAAPAAAQPPQERLLQRMVDFARALPQGRIELESATLRAFERDANGGLTGRPVRIPRLSIQRTPDGARLHGNALLAERLGRSLFVAMELRGLDMGVGALTGSITVQGRGLRLAGWRAALGGRPAGAAGVGDLRALLRVGAGRLQAGTVELSASELSLPRADGAGQARFANLRSSLAFERLAAGWSIRGYGLRLTVPGVPATTLDFELDADAAWSQARLHADGVPVGWLRPLFALPPELNIDGTLRELRLSTIAASNGRALRFEARIEDGIWRDAAGQVRLEPLVFEIAGSETGATLTFADEPLRLRLDSAPHEQSLEIAVQGSVTVYREAAGWRLDSRSLVLLDRGVPAPRARLEFKGTLAAVAPDSAALAVEVMLLEPVSSHELPLLRELSQRMLTAAPIDSFALAAGRFAIDAVRTPEQGWRIERSSGDLAVSSASFRPSADWPTLSEAGGRLAWDPRELRFDFERGSIGDLRLVRGQLRRGSAPAWSLVAEGPAVAALDALAASPLAPRVPAELRTAAIDGAARFELRVEPRGTVGRAGGQRSEPLSWSLLAHFDSLRWRMLADLPPVEALSGTLRIVDGRLQASRLEGRWLDQPLRIVVDAGSAGRRWRLTGRLPDGAMRELLAESGVPGTVGAAFWRLEARPERSDASRWRVDAALDGAPLRGRFELAASAEGFALHRGALRLGSGSLRLPASPIVEVHADLPQLELSRLARVWAELPRQGAARSPLRGALRIERLELLGEPLGPAILELGAAHDVATLSLTGARLAGTLSVGDGGSGAGGVPRLELERLLLPRLPGRVALTSTAAASPWALELRIADLRLGIRQLGIWRGRLESRRDRLVVEPMALDAGSIGVHGRLDCRREALRCTLEAHIEGGEARTALALWGLPGGFDAARVEGALQLAWPVAAADEVWVALDGELRLSARHGTLDGPARLGLLAGPASSWSWDRLDVEARAGRGRVDLTRVAFEGAQRLLLTGTVELPSAQTRLDGQWWPGRELPRVIEDWPAAPALAAVWRAVRGPRVLPRAVRVTGPADALGMELLPLQSPPPP